MKKTILFLFIVFLCRPGIAQTITAESLNSAAKAFMLNRGLVSQVQSVEPLLSEERELVGFLFSFAPEGFLVVSASEKISPVYAYSVDEPFESPGGETDLLKKMISYDLRQRIEGAEKYALAYQVAVDRAWNSFLECFPGSVLFEQWPPEGTTSTGGWLETNWTQYYPFNAMCPMDLNAQSRSLAGCPAVAMSMVLNYHREINSTRFSSGDDYYHNFGSGNQYIIDDDYAQRGFPCFDTLNLWLDTLEQFFMDSTALTENLQAALCFACGVSAQQVYSASSSGTFGLGQAIMAYQRFGFMESELVYYANDSTLASKIAENIKVKLPVHLGLKIQGGSGGHNLVVDGYNTDEFFHFNFGWGGSANGWYTLPPQPGIPYNLTIFNGAVINIKSDLFTGIPKIPSTNNEVTVFPNPSGEQVTITGITGPADLKLYDLTGREVRAYRISGNSACFRVSGLPAGCYTYQIQIENVLPRSGKLIVR
jgi:hypothetical protein